MTIGLLDLAITLNPDDFSLRHLADAADALLHRPVAREAAV